MKSRPVKVTGDDLKQIRRMARMTQSELAEWLGVSRETVCRRETGTADLTRETEMAMRFLHIAESGLYDFPWHQTEMALE